MCGTVQDRVLSRDLRSCLEPVRRFRIRGAGAREIDVVLSSATQRIERCAVTSNDSEYRGAVGVASLGMRSQRARRAERVRLGRSDRAVVQIITEASLDRGRCTRSRSRGPLAAREYRLPRDADRPHHLGLADHAPCGRHEMPRHRAMALCEERRSFRDPRGPVAAVPLRCRAVELSRSRSGACPLGLGKCSGESWFRRTFAKERRDSPMPGIAAPAKPSGHDVDEWRRLMRSAMMLRAWRRDLSDRSSIHPSASDQHRRCRSSARLVAAFRGPDEKRPVASVPVERLTPSRAPVAMTSTSHASIDSSTPPAAHTPSTTITVSGAVSRVVIAKVAPVRRRAGARVST